MPEFGHRSVRRTGRTCCRRPGLRAERVGVDGCRDARYRVLAVLPERPGGEAGWKPRWVPAHVHDPQRQAAEGGTAAETAVDERLLRVHHRYAAERLLNHGGEGENR